MEKKIEVQRMLAESGGQPKIQPANGSSVKEVNLMNAVSRFNNHRKFMA